MSTAHQWDATFPSPAPSRHPARHDHDDGNDGNDGNDETRTPHYLAPRGSNGTQPPSGLRDSVRRVDTVALGFAAALDEVCPRHTR